MDIKDFFDNSMDLDWMVLRPLDHIKANWELTWDHVNSIYFTEDESYAEQLNFLIFELNQANPPKKYHLNEDALAEYVKKELGWEIEKKGNRWIGTDYPLLLEQGGFHDIYEKNLILAAAGRIQTAIKLGQTHFDEMEESLKKILASVLSIILYHRIQ